MSAAMAAYLVAAGSAPADEEGAARPRMAAKTKGKKGEQLAAQPQAESAEASAAAHAARQAASAAEGARGSRAARRRRGTGRA